jgi:glucose/arabinose dehydrogenase
MTSHPGASSGLSRRGLLVLVAGVVALPAALSAQAPKPLISGLKNPTAVAIGADERVYVALAGEPGKAAGGSVVRIDGGKAVPFADGLDRPRGLTAWKDSFFVAERNRVSRIGKTGKAEVYLDAAAFPKEPSAFADLDVDDKGTVYVLDSGMAPGDPPAGGAVFRATAPGRKVELLADRAKSVELEGPVAIAADGAHQLLVLDSLNQALFRFRPADRSFTPVARGIGGRRSGGIAFDKYGRLFIADGARNRILAIPRPGIEPVVLAQGFRSVGKFCLDAAGKALLVPDAEAGTVTAVPTVIPGFEVDETPLPLAAEVAFPHLKWTGWRGLTASQTVNPLRPLVLTHAGDGSNRVFVATQHGVIHVFPNDQKAEKTEIFLDLSDRVRYDDKANEEGFLGLAFHPKYKDNGELFAFYTLKSAKLVNVLSRFRVSKDNPSRADPASEEVLLSVQRPFWNHDGGTICFGPDGLLYLALGDGGSANDPFGHGQNLNSLLGKILRLDVDRKDAGKPYAVPRDNPFVGRKDARPEIWAYGLRNVWRMAFDRKTGRLWAGDVGQDLYEEINHIVAGGNYGWNLREALHPFGNRGVGPRPDLIDPIWEYHHSIGKSITGGGVYRGSRLPELEGHYLYADYISGIIRAIRYDDAAKRVTAHRTVGTARFAVVSWGEDEAGEAYFLVVTVKGQGIHRFTPVRAGK